MMAEAQSGGGSSGHYLLCYDGSDAAANAIRRAGEITGGGQALVVHGWLPPSALLLQGRQLGTSHPLAPAVEDFDESAREAAEQLTADGARIAAEAGFEAEPLAIEAADGVWRPIVELAEEHEVDAVVVGSHRRPPLKAAFLGSVSHGIATHCARPVIIVPPEPTSAK